MKNRHDAAIHNDQGTSPAPHFETPSRRRRVVLYSHDTMGLGHMRRNLLIAQALVHSASPPIILMVTGAREAGCLPLPPGVDCLTLPALTKDVAGHHRARDLDLTLSEMTHIRSRSLAAAIEAFEPDALIVDKVPRGASRELDLALAAVKARGSTRCILGLRDILDEPETVRREWSDAACDEAIEAYYDAVWVYGDPAFYDPVHEYGFCPEVAAKVRYTGYLDQQMRLIDDRPDGDDAHAGGELPDGRLILCELGGGQDGAVLAESFVRARLPEGSAGVLLTGPYLDPEVRSRIRHLAAQQPRLRVLEFLAEPSRLLRRAERVITMGGYNTVCEILSFQKPALIVPRIHPRQEQWIRAVRLRDRGLADVLHPGELTPEALGNWMARDLPPVLPVRDRLNWNGLANLPRLLDELLASPSRRVRNLEPASYEGSPCNSLTATASVML